MKILGPPYDSRSIANFIIAYANSEQESVTNLQLLKILYFCHGWYLLKNDTALIKDRFEAWKYGPVIRQVYDNFKEFKDDPICKMATKFDTTSLTHTEVIPEINRDDRSFIIGIYKSYSTIHAYDLIRLTHEEGSPWHEMWVVNSKKVHVGMYISNERIRDHFSLISRNQPQH